MSLGFPLYINLDGNNCTIFGGSEKALRRAVALRQFGAKVTVISPTLCAGLEQMSLNGEIRHIPRKYFRGDCTSAQLCIAATDEPSTNVAISTECKAKAIPVEVTNPKEYGNFTFPRVVIQEDVVVSVAGDVPSEKLRRLRDRLQQAIPGMLEHDDEPEK
ncbi:MAG: bifunctional precorrin-2 dehydrogenase/sirohydrochlorin ferrochelatase [Clostridia bacterium]|nr:bifunctional precorrin-2 dehydrogenase/sirohydrochlorin ferrochelatase [Clostridia bacterium]